MRALVLILIFAATVRCFAQGTVNFANLAPGVDAPVRDASGQLCVGCMAQLYVGPANTTDPSLLVISGSPAQFLPEQPGYFQGGNRTLAGFPAGTTVTFQVRAWATASGSSWNSALERGESNLIQVTLTGGSVNLVGLQPFSLSIVPEPSSIAIAALGLLAIMFSGVRRRSR
jgi:hypothetical protein